jgi:hypothetical protein
MSIPTPYSITTLPTNHRHYMPQCVLDTLYAEAEEAGHKCLGASFIMGDKTDLIFDEDFDGRGFVLKREYA